MSRLLATLLSLAVVACSSGGVEDRSPEEPAQERPADDQSPSRTATTTPAHTPAGAPSTLEPYPGAEEFCDGRVYLPAGRGHMSWSSYATSDSRSAVVKHYKELLGEVNLEELPEKANWRFPKDRPTRVLSVESPKAEAPWKNECGVPDNARAIVTISHLPR